MKALLLCALLSSLALSCAAPVSPRPTPNAPRARPASGAEVEAERQATPPPPELIDALTTLEAAGGDRARLDVLVRLTEMAPHPEMVRPVMALLDGTVLVDLLPVEAYACGLMAGVAMASPEALEDDHVRALVAATARSNDLGQHLYTECAPAVAAFGDRAIPFVLEAYDGESGRVNAWYEALGQDPDAGVADTEVARKGHMVRLLVALRARGAAGKIASELRRPRELGGMPPRQAQEYALGLMVMLESHVHALGVLGSSGHEAPLLWILSGAAKEQGAWGGLLEGDVAASIAFRVAAADALARMGAQNVAPEILEVAISGADPDLKKVKSYLKERGQPMAPEDAYALNLAAARAYAALARTAEVAAFDAKLGGVADAELAAALAGARASMDVVVQCANEEKVKCYSRKLGTGDALVSEKAIFELGRMPPGEDVSAALVRALEVEALEARELVAFFLYLHPTEDALPVIRRLIEEGEGQGAARRLERRKLEALETYIMTR
jgi:hypothetical protein